MTDVFHFLAEEVSNYTSQLLRVSRNPVRIPNSSELENLFDKISVVVQGNQNSIAFTFESISHYVALRLTSLVESHSLLIDYTLLTCIALFIVVIGSFASIASIPYTALPPTKIHPLFDPSDFDVDHDCHIVYKNDAKSNKKLGIMDEKHAILLPVSSGVTLVALYFIITRLDIQWMKYIMTALNWNIKLMNIPATAFVYSYVFHSIARHLSHRGFWDPLYLLPRYRVTLTDDNDEINTVSGIVSNFHYQDALSEKFYNQDLINSIEKNPGLKHWYKREFAEPSAISSKRQIFNIYFDDASTISLLFGFISTVIYHNSPQNWLMTNMLSISLSIWSISQMTLKNLKTGTFILAALFFYDIYFVFGTDVMVTVATNVDLPIKLSVPTNYDKLQNKFDFAILGLGDIVLPGIFIASCYKFDIWKYHFDFNDTEFHLLNWSYVGKYFITSCISYVLSLVTCMAALTKFQTAQPALLYIVPYLIVSTTFVAWISGDFHQFWNFQYDTIELGENVLKEDSSDKEETDKLVKLMTYSEYIGSQEGDLLDDDDEEDYTEEDAILDGDKFDYDKYEYDSDDLDDGYTVILEEE